MASTQAALIPAQANAPASCGASVRRGLLPAACATTAPARKPTPGPRTMFAPEGRGRFHRLVNRSSLAAWTAPRDAPGGKDDLDDTIASWPHGRRPCRGRRRARGVARAGHLAE